MKKSQSLLALLMIVLLSLGYIVSCKNDSETPIKQDDSQQMEIDGQQARINLGPNSTNNSYVLEQEAFVDDQLTLPKGTKVQKNENDPHSFSFTLPTNYRLVGSNARVSAIALAGGKVTCKCTQGSGCSPFVSTIQKTTIGCLMNDQCGACTKTTSAVIAGAETEITNSEVINLSSEMHFVTDKSELASLKCMSPEIFGIKEVQDELRKFVNAYQGKNTEQLYKATTIEEMPENYEFVALSAYGRVMLVPVDRTLDYFLTNPITNAGYVSRARVATAQTCSCGSGASGCTKGSATVPFLGKVMYCAAGNCKTCTMNF